MAWTIIIRDIVTRLQELNTNAMPVIPRIGEEIEGINFYRKVSKVEFHIPSETIYIIVEFERDAQNETR